MYLQGIHVNKYTVYNVLITGNSAAKGTCTTKLIYICYMVTKVQ